MQDGKKQEKGEQELTCTFSKLVIKEDCVAYGTSTRQNNPAFHGPFFNLYVALVWILHTFKDKKPQDLKTKIGQLISNFPGLSKDVTINVKELRAAEFANADGLQRAKIIEEVCGKYEWLAKTNTTKRKFLESRKKSSEKPKEEAVIIYSYNVQPELQHSDGKPKDCQYIARRKSGINIGKDLTKCHHIDFKGSTYSLHHNPNSKEKDNVAILHVFPGCGLDELSLKGRVEVVGRKPLHRLDEEEKKKWKDPEYKMDVPKALPLTAIASKPFGSEEKDPSRKRKRKEQHEEFLKGVVNFALDD
jgi:hypothetical protein